MLATSPDFTSPQYAANENIIDTKVRDDMLNRALPFGAQAAITLGACRKEVEGEPLKLGASDVPAVVVVR